MNKVILTVGSVTYAIKARKILSRNNISAKLIKVDSAQSANGCTHGIEISEKNFLSAVKILKDSMISYSIYKDGRYK